LCAVQLLLPALLVLGYGLARRTTATSRFASVSSLAQAGAPKLGQVLVCKGSRCRAQGALVVWRRLRTARE